MAAALAGEPVLKAVGTERMFSVPQTEEGDVIEREPSAAVEQTVVSCTNIAALRAVAKFAVIVLKEV
ncbi:hypothetical protein GW7_11399 [Heterocephalus glaber]|uniref:Uncharacterized protein n=1 Tax=Heterocephalus glaber TaxID=10181 RepID=G5C964_HETGA|nr:hypothetical protein GW7_11399 [Heterocephalus glaber]